MNLPNKIRDYSYDELIKTKELYENRQKYLETVTEKIRKEKIKVSIALHLLNKEIAKRVATGNIE